MNTSVHGCTHEPGNEINHESLCEYKFCCLKLFSYVYICVCLKAEIFKIYVP
jgi:hypothetical protein